jgi:hypothetical protein
MQKIYKFNSLCLPYTLAMVLKSRMSMIFLNVLCGVSSHHSDRTSLGLSTVMCFPQV